MSQGIEPKQGNRVVIAGASLAALRSAEALRGLGYEGQIVMVGDESHPPYTRPPLSKRMLSGPWEPESLFLRSESELADLNVTLMLGCSVATLNLADRKVSLSCGDSIEFDGFVIATGARPRVIPALASNPGAFTLRTIDNARALRKALDGSDSVTVIGGGYIGAEVAATLRDLGKRVSLIEPQPGLMLRGIGPDISKALERIHREQGVDVRTGVSISGISNSGRTTTLDLSDHSSVSSDVTLVGIGARPNTEWLEGSGLRVDDGVVCDAKCRALDESGDAIPGVVAVGDVARWYSRTQQQTVRLEHWSNAQEQPHSAVATLAFDLGLVNSEPDSYDPVPYVWSDQFGKKLQIAGHVQATDHHHVVMGSLAEDSFLVLSERDHRLVGAIGLAQVRGFSKVQRILGSNGTVGDAVAALSA